MKATRSSITSSLVPDWNWHLMLMLPSSTSGMSSIFMVSIRAAEPSSRARLTMSTSARLGRRRRMSRS